MFKQPRHLFEFGRFRLDRTERFLFQDGAPVPLSPRLFDTLMVLVENRGHVVQKNDLMQKVWNDVAVEENNLTQSISALRKILGITSTVRNSSRPSQSEAIALSLPSGSSRRKNSETSGPLGRI
jgi:DNA-binding winged helix-turn-helix (wHTH) protein